VSALFMSEVERDLSRRLVWVLVGVALLGTAVAGVVVWTNADRPSGNQFQLTELWPRDRDAGPLLAAPVIFLAIGGLLGGASMVGAEWRAGTMTTVLTWEPRRVRVAVAKLAAAGVLAFLIAVLLLGVFCLALVPAGVRGSREGTDAAWFGGLVGGVLRGGLLTSFAAVLGASVAMVGRNTAAALGGAFAYLMVGENVLRAWKPWLVRWLIGENSATVLLGGTPDAAPFQRSVAVALATLALYVGVLAVAAVASFRARDVSGV
jgi:hypothetical protein